MPSKVMPQEKSERVERDGYYVVAAFLAIIFTLLVHYFVLARFDSIPTVHAAFGVGLFILLSSLFSAILRRMWH